MPRQRSTHRDARPARGGRLGRCLAVLGVVGLGTGGPVLAAGPATAAAAQSQVTISILSVSPQVAGPRQPVTVTGTVSNPTRSAVSGLAVTLWSSTAQFTSRAEMASYAADDLNLRVDAPVTGAVTLLPGSLAPGTTEQWTVTARPANLHLTRFGVYPLAAQVSTNGQPLNHQRTFLPFWPGSAHRAGLAQREKLAWVWPLIGQPQQQSCTALLTDQLAGSLAPAGRLGRLLAEGSAPAASGADLTWAIDPSLAASAKIMTRSYQVGGTAACAGPASKQASAAARSWLKQLSSVTARQDFFTTPYADVDVAALTHAGLGDDITRAYRSGQATAQQLLGSAQRPAGQIGQIAWPAAGIADYPVLSSLAA
ncbi:MAG TPA: hypothetical protein VMK13_11675, partial [Streptosporangiaceae bacterium]|nr:hypothetical protein [Streptosporangiaceae bacterium]